MRVLCLLLALLLAPAALAQDAAKKKKPLAQKKQTLAQKKQTAHKKPTPEQIRRFNELQKKR